MRPQAQIGWPPDPNFARLAVGRRVLIIRRDLLPHAAAVVANLGRIAASPPAGAGNRQSGYRLSIPDAPEMFARRARRGGIMRHLLTETFVGVTPRPLHELEIAAKAHRRGIPIAEPFGAAVEWIVPGIYRGFFISRAISGMTLWEFLKTDDEPVVREHVLMRARAAIAAMHDQGLFHADLNLHNLMVTQSGETFAIVILDLDRARLFDGSLAPALRRANAERLLRSARKLDPEGKILDKAALRILDLR